jgi:hypothetical protein
VEFDDPVVLAISDEDGIIPEPLRIVLVVEHVGVATSNIAITVIVG